MPVLAAGAAAAINTGGVGAVLRVTAVGGTGINFIVNQPVLTKAGSAIGVRIQSLNGNNTLVANANYTLTAGAVNCTYNVV